MPIELIELQQPWGYFLLRELMLCGPGNVISMSFVFGGARDLSFFSVPLNILFLLQDSFSAPINSGRRNTSALISIRPD